MNALAETVAAQPCFQAPAPTCFSLYPSANTISSALCVCRGEMSQTEWQSSSQKTQTLICALLHTEKYPYSLH